MPGAMGSLRRHGFTLVELVAVLAILLLLAGLATVAVGRQPAFLSLAAAAGEVRVFLDEARREAMVRGVERQISVRNDGRRLERGAGDDFAALQIPDGMELQVEGAAAPDGAAPAIRFFPDGTGAGPRLRLGQGGQALRIAVSPLTGQPTVHEEAE